MLLEFGACWSSYFRRGWLDHEFVGARWFTGDDVAAVGFRRLLVASSLGSVWLLTSSPELVALLLLLSTVHWSQKLAGEGEERGFGGVR